MHRLSCLFVVAALLVGACQRSAAPTASVPEPAPPEPFKFKDYNVVLVSFDALQASHVGALGYDRNTTPTLDAMARSGFKFTRAYSAASWTVPSCMTWFTGVYPSEHRMVNKFAVYSAREQKIANLKDVAPELFTLAQVFRANGYATGGFTGNAGVSPGFGYDIGFDVYYHRPNTFGSFDESAPRALDWVRANRDRKFFLFLHGYDCHGQSVPAGGLDYRFADPGYDKRFTGSPQEQERLREEGLDRGRLTLRDADVKFWRAVYDEKINRADARFKQFLDEFDKLGLTGKTLFIITSDHGTEFYEHGRFDHGFTLYEELVRVPLILKLPGHAGGTAITDRVGIIDLMPTVLDLADVFVSDDVRKQLRGQSLVPSLKGQPVARDVFCETDYRAYTYKRAVITPAGEKLIYTLESRTRELYDLGADPSEQNDLSKSDPRRADALQQKVFDHWKSLGHDLTARTWEPGLNPVYPSQGAPKK